MTAAELLARAREIEGRRVDRTLTEADCMVFIDAVRKHPTSRIRVWAGRGWFVPLKFQFHAPITILEYTPADGYGPAQTVVSEGDARRPAGKGPWVEIDGKKEI